MNSSLGFVPEIRFWKCQSVGNDFVLIQLEESLDLPSIARSVCPRRFSVGADGLLAVRLLTNDVDEGRVPDLELRMFNPDGSEDFCGNGMRCAAAFAKQRGWISHHCIIHHYGKDVAATVDDGGIVHTTSPSASYKPSDVPLAEGLTEIIFEPMEFGNVWVKATALTTGSTHTVLQVDQLPCDDDFFRIGPALESDPRFPARTSVIFVVSDREDHLSIRIWERGVGETLGCGTGSAAAAAVKFRELGRGGQLMVSNPGGDVMVKMESPFSAIHASAMASVVYCGSLNSEMSSFVCH